MMVWKVERWLEEVFPGPDRIYSAYRDLTAREAAIVSAGVLDLALAQLLHKRLATSEREAIKFLGLDGDGRAPAGSFGARIQLAILVRLIDEDDAGILRTIKGIRNVFAHRIDVDFCSTDVRPLVESLLDRFERRSAGLAESTRVRFNPAGFACIRENIESTKEAGHALLLAVFGQYQAYFHLLSEFNVVIPTIFSEDPTCH